jgi:phytoene desaturase
MTDRPNSPGPSSAIVIGAGLGGLSAAMRLGAKGYRVTLLDRLDRVAGVVRLSRKTATASIWGPPS